MSTPNGIFWFRQDLRLADNPGLWTAVQSGKVLPVYIWDEAAQGDFKRGAATCFALSSILTHLNDALGGHLHFYSGDTETILLSLCQKYDIRSVYWNRCYEPYRLAQDSLLMETLSAQGIAIFTFNAFLLWEPWAVLKSDGTPYKVFTPYYNRGCLQSEPPRELFPSIEKASFLKDAEASFRASFFSKASWQDKLTPHAVFSETEVWAQFLRFVSTGLVRYEDFRNYPSRLGVSKLAMAFHFGLLSPHQVWDYFQTHSVDAPTADVDCFLKQLAWREFSYYLLYHFPALPTQNFNAKFDAFPWKSHPTYLKAWQQGKTGYPLVDAGMRELWETGSMHNRVRMVVASFLVKNLQVDWRLGAAWFWDCLLDADLANNSASWQWVAGSGADAAPYFRVFNPVTQAEKFDPEGVYVRLFLPELKDLPLKFLFKPWEAPVSVLNTAGIVLGDDYPYPIVSLSESRLAALDAYASL